MEKNSSTTPAVNNPSTNRNHRGSTSVIGREPLFTTCVIYIQVLEQRDHKAEPDRSPEELFFIVISDSDS